MIKIEHISVFNFENALRGMRNPLNSWDQSDSFVDSDGKFHIGEKDMELALKLVKAGTDHSKFMRQIFVSMDIIAPLYWWKEMDTYKVATTANSTSTMHTLGKRLLTVDDFSWDEVGDYELNSLAFLNSLIEKWQVTKDKKIWRRLIQNLPDGYNQKRTWTGNYQVLRRIYFSRKNHKLDEWREFCKVIEGLDYSILITVV